MKEAIMYVLNWERRWTEYDAYYFDAAACWQCPEYETREWYAAVSTRLQYAAPPGEEPKAFSWVIQRSRDSGKWVVWMDVVAAFPVAYDDVRGAKRFCSRMEREWQPAPGDPVQLVNAA